MAGTNAVLGGGGFHHVALRAADIDASEAFYTEVLGFVPVLRWGEGDGRAIMLDTGDGGIVEIFAGGTGPKPEGSILHFALNCQDIDGVTEKVRAAGMEITVEPKSVDIPSTPAPKPVRLAFFKGLDGEVVELFHERR